MKSVMVVDDRGYTTVTSWNDERGRRIRSSLTSSSLSREWIFFYDQSDRLIAMRATQTASGVTTQRQEMYFWVDQEMVFRYVLNGGVEERTFMYNDQLGTPRVAVNVDGAMANANVVYRATDEPFMAGTPRLQAGGSTGLRQRFPGQWSDDESRMTTSVSDASERGVIANGARFYDAVNGAYVSSEPMLWGASGAGAMPFTYAAARPTSAWDPDGRLVLVLGGVAIGVADLLLGGALVAGLTYVAIKLKDLALSPSQTCSTDVDREYEQDRCQPRCAPHNCAGLHALARAACCMEFYGLSRICNVCYNACQDDLPPPANPYPPHYRENGNR